MVGDRGVGAKDQRCQAGDELGDLVGGDAVDRSPRRGLVGVLLQEGDQLGRVTATAVLGAPVEADGVAGDEGGVLVGGGISAGSTSTPSPTEAVKGFSPVESKASSWTSVAPASSEPRATKATPAATRAKTPRIAPMTSFFFEPFSCVAGAGVAGGVGSALGVVPPVMDIAVPPCTAVTGSSPAPSPEAGRPYQR